jgi:hypothetical protein
MGRSVRSCKKLGEGGKDSLILGVGDLSVTTLHLYIFPFLGAGEETMEWPPGHDKATSPFLLQTTFFTFASSIGSLLSD